MEKYRAHRTLSNVKSFIALNKVRATVSAFAGGAALGLDFDGIVDIVQKLRPSDFHKSMTSYHDHRIWQDVYKPTTSVGEIYLKLVVMDDVLIVSCKEL